MFSVGASAMLMQVLFLINKHCFTNVLSMRYKKRNMMASILSRFFIPLWE